MFRKIEDVIKAPTKDANSERTKWEGQGVTRAHAEKNARLEALKKAPKTFGKRVA